jgi:hypothetical protein
MKTLFSILLLTLMSLFCHAQGLDTTVQRPYACVKIMPFKAKWRDPLPVTHLGIRITGDNLTTQCNLNWHLYDADGNILDEGAAELSGDDYVNWPATAEEVNAYPFYWFAQKNDIEFLIE